MGATNSQCCWVLPTLLMTLHVASVGLSLYRQWEMTATELHFLHCPRSYGNPESSPARGESEERATWGKL